MTFTDEPNSLKPKAIADPWHSRPLDVHGWSDHRHALRPAGAIRDEHFEVFARADNVPGPKPKTTCRNQLKVV